MHFFKNEPITYSYELVSKYRLDINSDLHCVIGTSYWSIQLYIVEKTQCLQQNDTTSAVTDECKNSLSENIKYAYYAPSEQ